MKRIKIIFLFLFFYSFVVAQPIKFLRTYGYSNHDALQSKQTADGGYILYGEKNLNTPAADLLIIKTDSAGTITWAKTYGTAANEEIWGLEILKNGYLISASTSINTGIRFMLLIDSVGNIMWNKTNVLASHMVQTSNGGLVFTSPDPYNSITKLDSNFNLVWRKKYDIQSNGIATSLGKALDGGFIIAGNMLGFHGSLDFNVIRTDSLGNILWAKMYGGINDEWFPNIETTFDGGCIMIGSTQSYGAGYNDIFLIKLDPIGNVQWAKTFGGPLADEGAFVKPTSGSIGYILSGNTQGFSVADDSANISNNRCFMIKTDINGNYQWARRYGIGPQDNGGAIQTKDGGYNFSGFTAAWGAGGYEGWMIKTDNLGNVGCYDWSTIPIVTSPVIMDSTLTWTESNDTLTFGGPEILFDSVATPFTTIECLSGPAGTGIADASVSFNMTIDIFPNPSTGKFQIESSKIKIQSIEIYNMFGEKIYSVSSPSFIQTNIDLSSNLAGIYFVLVNTKEGSISKKIILEK